MVILLTVEDCKLLSLTGVPITADEFLFSTSLEAKTLTLGRDFLITYMTKSQCFINANKKLLLLLLLLLI